MIKKLTSWMALLTVLIPGTAISDGPQGTHFLPSPGAPAAGTLVNSIFANAWTTTPNIEDPMTTDDQGGELAVRSLAGGGCTYFQEDFSGTSGIIWTPSFASWTAQGGVVEAWVSADTMGNYATSFSPSGLFHMDVEVEWLEGSHIDAAYGILPYTSGNTFFQVDNRDVSGVGVIVYPNRGNARLLAWDVPGQTWYQSDPLTLPASVTSIGVAYEEHRVVLRLNGENTALSFSGEFSYAPGTINTLWLLAQFSGTRVRFDNVCSGPEGASPPPGPLEYMLTVTKTGTGSGTVTSSPQGINCGWDCTETFPSGTAITLSAASDSGSTFSGWSGGGCSGTGGCSVSISEDISITAAFAVKQTTNLMPLPDGKQSFPYNPIATPVKSLIPSQARPIGVGAIAEGKDTFDISVGMEGISGPVDIYLALFAAHLDPHDYYLFRSDGSLANLSVEGLVPWKEAFTGPIDEMIFSNVPLKLIPPGTYSFYLLMTPHGNINTFYFWATSFVRPGAYLQVNPDPDDPMLGILSGMDSDFQILFSGRKDQQGYPLKIDTIQFYENGIIAGETPATFFFGEDGLLSLITGPEGQAMTFSYEDGDVFVRSVDRDGNITQELAPFDSAQLALPRLEESNNIKLYGTDWESLGKKVKTVVGFLKINARGSGIYQYLDLGPVKDATVTATATGLQQELTAQYNPDVDAYVLTVPTRVLDVWSTIGDCERLTANVGLFAGGVSVLGLAGTAFFCASPFSSWLCALGTIGGNLGTLTGITAGLKNWYCRESNLKRAEEITQGGGKVKVEIRAVHTGLDFELHDIVTYNLFDPEDTIATTERFQRDLTAVVETGLWSIGIPSHYVQPCQEYEVSFSVVPQAANVKVSVTGSDGYRFSKTIGDQGGGIDTTRRTSSLIPSGAPHTGDRVDLELELNGEILDSNWISFTTLPWPKTELKPIAGNPRDGCDFTCYETPQGQLKGNFYGKCATGYENGGEFTLTLRNGSVTGFYNPGGWGYSDEETITGTVTENGWLTADFDGEWGDCSIQGNVFCPAGGLMGEGTLYCSGSGGCHGDWQAETPSL